MSSYSIKKCSTKWQSYNNIKETQPPADLVAQRIQAVVWHGCSTEEKPVTHRVGPYTQQAYGKSISSVDPGDGVWVWDHLDGTQLFPAFAHLSLSLMMRLPEPLGFLEVWFTRYLHTNFLWLLYLPWLWHTSAPLTYAVHSPPFSPGICNSVTWQT